MGVIRVTYYTDPACPWSWAAEPAFARLQVEFPGAGRAHLRHGRIRPRGRRARHEVAVTALDASAASGMPVDARGWLAGAPRSSYPACIAVKAAAEQGLDGPYLRVLREGIMTGSRRARHAGGADRGGPRRARPRRGALHRRRALQRDRRGVRGRPRAHAGAARARRRPAGDRGRRRPSWTTAGAAGAVGCGRRSRRPSRGQLPGLDAVLARGGRLATRGGGGGLRAAGPEGRRRAVGGGPRVPGQAGACGRRGIFLVGGSAGASSAWTNPAEPSSSGPRGSRACWIYLSSDRTVCGAWLACASMAVPACWRIWSLVSLVISSAMSTSRMRLSAEVRFSW